MRSGSRFQFGLTLVGSLFVLATLFVILLDRFSPDTPAARAPIFLASLLAVLIGGLLCILFVLRWVLHPYRQLVGEAERASATTEIHRSKKDEATFVLETFQSVVGQLQEQREELEKLSAQARERADSAEKFSERIVASMPSGLIAFDSNGTSMSINLAGRDLMEINGEPLGQSYRDLLGKYPTLTEMVERCLQTGTLYRREEVEATAANGRPRRLGATIAPIDFSSDRGSRGALCLLTDITEVTLLREQVALKRNLENLGEMSAGLAHEFKNSIAALHGYVQLLQSLELNETGRAAAESLLNEVRNLSEMVTSFLNFARPQPLVLEPTSLVHLLEECASELRPLFAEHRVTLETNFAVQTEDSLEIRADERMLRQALLNVLRNAAEAVPEQQAERAVYLSARRNTEAAEKPMVMVQIRDTGEGISVSQLQKIFIPFFTTKSKGHGVGLALAHRVITQHGGSLTAMNAPQGGAVFTIKLPA